MVQSTINLEQFDTPSSGKRSHGGCGSCGAGGGQAERARCGNGLEKIYPTTAVRFGYMRNIGEFTHAPDMKFTCGARVVVQTKRGQELGEQVSLTCSGCDKSVTRQQIKDWVDTCGHDSFLFGAGRILREATAADLAEWAHIQQSCREKRDFSQALANRHKLSIKIVDCECTFGGERILFFFTAAERTDFRSMVKDLAKEYRTRIEMRQVGARDEARLLADYETCGREVCCKVFLKTLRPISMRMAKVQKATLDPAQVSGRCGRLKCCLRYEHVGYEELDKKLPRVGVRIRTHHGEGVIVNRQILTQLVQIRTDADQLVTVVAEDITERGVKTPPAQAKPAPSFGARESRRPPSTRHREIPGTDPPTTRPATDDEADAVAKGKEPDGPKETDAQPAKGEQRPAGQSKGPRRRGRRRRRRPGRGDTSSKGPSPPPA